MRPLRIRTTRDLIAAPLFADPHAADSAPRRSHAASCPRPLTQPPPAPEAAHISENLESRRRRSRVHVFQMHRFSNVSLEMNDTTSHRPDENIHLGPQETI